MQWKKNIDTRTIVVHLQLVAGDLVRRCHPVVIHPGDRRVLDVRLRWTETASVERRKKKVRRAKLARSSLPQSSQLLMRSRGSYYRVEKPLRETQERPKCATIRRVPSSHSPFWFTLTVVPSRAARCPARRATCACARQVAAWVSYPFIPTAPINSPWFRWRAVNTNLSILSTRKASYKGSYLSHTLRS